MNYEEIVQPFKERSDLLTFIKEVHRRRGYLTADDIRGIAAAWGDATVGEVYGIATFYSFLAVGPLGRFVVKVCKSTPCCMKGCKRTADAVRNALGVGEGQTTPDGAFSMMLVNCIGQCDGAPAMLVNDDVHRHLQPEKVRDILSKYASLPQAASARSESRA